MLAPPEGNMLVGADTDTGPANEEGGTLPDRKPMRLSGGGSSERFPTEAVDGGADSLLAGGMLLRTLADPSFLASASRLAEFSESGGICIDGT